MSESAVPELLGYRTIPTPLTELRETKKFAHDSRFAIELVALKR
jgi:hypothetical protein